MEQRYVFALTVQNIPGVLARISGLLTRRGFNIDAISAAETETPEISLMMVVFRADEYTAKQIRLQLEKQVDVYSLKELKSPEAVIREHVMIKVEAQPSERMEIISVAGIYRASIVDVSPESMIIELTGESSKTAAFVEAVKPYGIIQVARASVIGMQRQGKPVLKKKFEDI